MAILQSIRCHKSYKTHVFLSSRALQGKLLGFHSALSSWFVKLQQMQVHPQPLDLPQPTYCITHVYKIKSLLIYQIFRGLAVVHESSPSTTEHTGQDSYRTQSQSQKKKKKKKRHWRISASPAWRHSWRELLEVGGGRRTSRTHTQPKPPAGAKLAL